MKWSKYCLKLLLNLLSGNTAACYWTSAKESIAAYTEKQNDNRELECRQLNILDDNKFALL